MSIVTTAAEAIDRVKDSYLEHRITRYAEKRREDGVETLGVRTGIETAPIPYRQISSELWGRKRYQTQFFVEIGTPDELAAREKRREGVGVSDRIALAHDDLTGPTFRYAVDPVYPTLESRRRPGESWVPAEHADQVETARQHRDAVYERARELVEEEGFAVIDT